jgi:lipoprotein-releasing system ATP-binding protein
MSEPLIQVAGLQKSYGSGAARVEVLRGIDLSVQAGESVALVGASGAGKSTLLHLLGALDRPTAGEVRFAGEDIFRRSDQQLAAFRNRSIGFVFQFHHLLPEFTALENAMMPALISGMRRDEAIGIAADLLAAVGLGHRVTHKPGELSGGEQQRVAIARSLSLSPRLVLADEPTGNLDMKTSSEIHDLFARLREQIGITLVVVTHNEQLAARLERTVRLVDGKLADS